MKDQTLASVDENLIKTGKFLEDISSNRKKLDCLACFAQCQEVIIWLRDVTKGTQVDNTVSVVCDIHVQYMYMIHVTLYVICSFLTSRCQRLAELCECCPGNSSWRRG